MTNKSCEEFVKELSSKEAVPGGGGASALVGAIGTALGTMVGNLTIGKKKYIDVEEDVKALMDKSEGITRELMALVQKDAEAFAPLAEAYRIPKDTEENIKKREEVIQSSVLSAAMVPLEIARLSVEAIMLQRDFAVKGSVLAVSDAGTGATICKAALLGARLNVLINLALMSDTKKRDELKKEIDEYTEKGSKEADEVYKLVEDKIWQ